MTYDPPSGGTEFPSLSLLVGVDEATLRSYFSHDWSSAGGNVVNFTVSAPDVLFVNDDDDNADGEEDSFEPGLTDDDVASGSILLKRTFSNVPVRVNTITSYEGAFFGDMPGGTTDSPITFTADPEWASTNTYTF